MRADANLTNSHRTTSIALGDYDQDGRLDAYVASHIMNINDAETMHQDRLFWNNGAGFTEVTELLGNIGDQTRLATFAAAWVDVDRTVIQICWWRPATTLSRIPSSPGLTYCG